MANYDSLDLRFSWAGDYSLGHDKDIADNQEDYLLSLNDQIHDIAASSLNDWEVYPKRASQLKDFIGKPNTSSNARRIEERLRLALTTANVVLDSDLEIKTIPVHVNELLIILFIKCTPTPNNKLTQSNTLVVQLVFDYNEQGVFFFDKPPKLIANS